MSSVTVTRCGGAAANFFLSPALSFAKPLSFSSLVQSLPVKLWRRFCLLFHQFLVRTDARSSSCPCKARLSERPQTVGIWAWVATSVVLPPGLPVAGEILVSHIRSIDTQARPVRHAGASVPQTVAQLVRAKLNTLITI
jgi:hypothetical protein